MPDSIDKLLFLAEVHCGKSIARDMISPIARGASGRTIVRIILPDGQTIIGVYWTAERDDNNSFVPVARMLDTAGIRVPRILAYTPEAEGSGSAIVADMGDCDLLSCAKMDWHERKKLYVSAMEELNKLHHVIVPSYLKLQDPFDKQLYRWEQEYFAEHFVQNMSGLSATEFLDHPGMILLAENLEKLPRTPLHRDFQSQNIHIIKNTAWLIDFQGMRLGRPEYDLASLLYDPYARLSASERKELIRSWEDICRNPLDREIFRNCAIQRIMQATGAFAKLSTMGNIWYSQHLPTAIETLRELTSSTDLEELFAPILNHAPILPC